MRCLLLTLFVLIGGMMQISSPEYYAKVLPISGSAFDLEDAGIQFTEVLRIPTQDNHGSFDIALRNVINPQNAHLASDYNKIDYEQRVEIYDNPDRSGCPVFAGVVTEPPSGDLTTTRIKGEDSTRRLETRRLRRYETINKNAASAAADMLNVYGSITFSDNFNTNSLSKWTTTGSLVSASNGKAYIKNDLSFPSMYTTASFSAAQWRDSKISLDDSVPALSYSAIDWWINNPSASKSAMDTGFRLNVSLIPTFSSCTVGTFALYSRTATVETTLAGRSVNFVANGTNHIDIFTISVNTGKQIIVLFNNLEIFNVIDTNSLAWSHSGNLKITNVMLSTASTSDYVNVDNVLIAIPIQAIVPGSFDSTTTTFNQVFNGNTQRSALNQIADTLGWEYRINPASGSGNDTLDFGASVGRDLSDVIILEEGRNIVQVQKHRTNEDLATWLHSYGQSQDEITTNFSSVNLSAFDTYGIVERTFSDPRIIDSTIAKLLGDQRLAILSAGNVSLSGTIIDESILFTQDPRWGYFVWGDMIYGGRQKLRPGDQVWMKVPRLNIDRKVTIVSLSRTGGTNAVVAIFDYFPWRKTDAYKETMRQFSALQIALANLMNAQGVHLILSGTTAQTWSVYLRGNQITNVYVDVTSNAWVGAVTVTIDGTDRTNALFGSATLTANAFANDTTYLVLSDVHTITITPTQTVTVDISIKTKVLS